MTGLHAPNLDDRDFAALFAEARSLIPRYTPEWTDHNLSDPGITLLQLFAWQAEQTLYRVNRIPERAYLKFLELLGIQLGTATPAGVELTFTTTGPTVDAVVPTGTQVATNGGDNGPIVFEVVEGFTAIGAPLAALQTFDGTAYRDHSGLLTGGVSLVSANAGSDIEVFGPHAPAGAALLLGFDSPASFTANPITLYATLPPGLGGDVVQTGVAVRPAGPAGRIQAEFHDGSRWQPTALLTDQTQAFTNSGQITLAGPGNRASKVKIGSVTARLYWVRLALVSSNYQNPPLLRRLALNTAPAIQGATVRDEVLGGSTGTPGQGPFTLSTVPVVRGEERDVVRSGGVVVHLTDLELRIDEGSGFEPWQQVPDFLASGPDDMHFVLDRSPGEIRFGDGRNGRIPVANPAHPGDNIVATWYRAGGSAAGNVGAGTVTSLQTAAFGVASVTNLAAASGGADPETVAHAKVRAPSVLKAGGRAVTAEDFVAIAMATPAAVGRVHALPLTHPGFPGVPVPGAVTVVVVPNSPGPAPVPTVHTLSEVCAQLEPHRLITTEVFATGPHYRTVTVVADLIVAPGSDLAVVQHAVSDRLISWLHPLTGGDDGTGWPFGGTIYASSLLGRILTTPGVARIRDNQMLVELDGERQMFCRDVEIGVGELLHPLTPRLVAGYR
ncbi:putative baseplate assembly protein [Arthrobacter humicola]